MYFIVQSVSTMKLDLATYKSFNHLTQHSVKNTRETVLVILKRNTAFDKCNIIYINLGVVYYLKNRGFETWVLFAFEFLLFLFYKVWEDILRHKHNWLEKDKTRKKVKLLQKHKTYSKMPIVMLCEAYFKVQIIWVRVAGTYMHFLTSNRNRAVMNHTVLKR